MNAHGAARPASAMAPDRGSGARRSGGEICPRSSSSSIPAISPSSGWKQQGVQRPLGARADRRRILGERELEEGVELDALAAEPGVVQDHAAGADVAGAGRAAAGRCAPTAARPAPAGCDRSGRSLHRRRPRSADQRRLKQTSASAPAAASIISQLEGVVVPGVHQLERQRGRAPPAHADLRGHLPQPAEDLCPLVGQSGRRRAWVRSPSPAPGRRRPTPAASRSVVWRYSASRKVSSEPREMVLHRGHAPRIPPARVSSPAARTSAEVVVERAIPASALPRHRPPLPPGSRADRARPSSGSRGSPRRPWRGRPRRLRRSPS